MKKAVLLSRMHSGEIRTAPIWDDVRTLSSNELGFRTNHIDMVYGGFPCQDISLAGAGAGLAGERSRLFHEIARLTSELRPSFVFLENVPAITTRGGQEVVGAFTSLGYDCRWCVISAESVGANHKRERWFFLAHALRSGCKKLNPTTITNREGHTSGGIDTVWLSNWWETEPAVGRVVDGVPNRVDRIKALGNAVVPLQARKAFEILIGRRADALHQA